MPEFVPDSTEDFAIPYFEDATNAVGVIGYSTTLTESNLQGKIKQAMADLGGIVTSFQQGHFGKRLAYRIEFIYHGKAGRMDVAALPIRKETDARVRQAKRQALFSVWKRLESQFNSILVSPGDMPLVPYMLDSRGRTMIEYLREEGMIPALPEPKKDDNVVDGEFRENDEEA